jgi:hypothetical protein
MAAGWYHCRMTSSAALLDAAFAAVEAAVAGGALPCGVLAVADRHDLVRLVRLHAAAAARPCARSGSRVRLVG